MKKQVQIGVGAGVVLIFLLALVVMRCEHRRAAQLSTATTDSGAPVVSVANNSLEMPDEQWIRTARKTVPEPPEQIVREKLANFGRSRRVLAERLAQKHGLGLTPEVEAFFAAIESGDWEQIEATFKAINGGDSSAGSSHTRSTAVSKMWPAIIDAFGAAEQAHYWPAQSLLENEEVGKLYLGA